MKAQELRVGNWVSITPFGKNNDIQINEKEFADLIIFKTFHRIEPIPLTEEWLLKFGFEKVKSRYEEAETFDYVLQPLYFDMANTSIKINGVYQKINYPESVHQLQNLYYSLTGEELCTK